MARELIFTIQPEEIHRKVQSILRSRGVSRRLLVQLKAAPGGILCNGVAIRAVDTAAPGDVLLIRLPEDAAPPENMPYPLDILYEDDDILVINKPAGLAMHPTHNIRGVTLANAVAAHLAAKGTPAAFRAVGRLDKGTSGLVLCALHSFAAFRLTGRAQKTYFALAHGAYRGSGSFCGAIYRPKPNCTLRACRPEGMALQPGDAAATTHWECLRCADGISYLRIWLETGRTHQIRAHFAGNGTPLLGDDYYGAPPGPGGRPFLHCGALEFPHPTTGEALRFTAPLPEDMAAIVKNM
ncbi:MAG: RluA family pseudouridine synthase [Oscillospiraceae bacterium]|nr:RluA family pseudouridine synthase [Oscillospiraceae bacterium]